MNRYKQDDKVTILRLPESIFNRSEIETNEYRKDINAVVVNEHSGVVRVMFRKNFRNPVVESSDVGALISKFLNETVILDVLPDNVRPGWNEEETNHG